MTLAVIFLFGILRGPAPDASIRFQEHAPQSSPADKQTAQSVTQDQSVTPKQDPTSAKPAAPQPSSGKPVAKRPHRKNKPVHANCENTSDATDTSAASTSSTVASAGAVDPKMPNGGASTKCPPAKVIVHQGGITEQSIQLAGGRTGNQASNERDTANRMLGTTEENLKKISARQLNESQQDMVNQIHQFMQQSKTAVAAGNLDRARTLAWKAELLSEELLKPEQ